VPSVTLSRTHAPQGSPAGPHVKIGISQDPKGRLFLIKSRRTWVVTPEDIDLGSLELLATEPGGLSLEHQRQQEFRADYVAGEWCARMPHLGAWIQAVRTCEGIAMAS